MSKRTINLNKMNELEKATSTSSKELAEVVRRSQVTLPQFEAPKFDLPISSVINSTLKHHIEVSQVAAKIFSDFTSPLFEISKRFGEQFEPHRNALIEANKVLAEVLRPNPKFEKMLIDFHQSIRPVSDFLSRLDQVIPKEFFENLLKHSKETDRIHLLHAEDKTFIPPYFDEFTAPEVFGLFEDESKTSIEIYHTYFLQMENAQRLLKLWAANEYFKPRMRILLAAVDAHVAKKFEISIVLFMREFEGLILEMPSVNQKRMKARVKDVFPARKIEPDSFSHLSVQHMFADIVCDEVFNPNEQEGHCSTGLFPNRHKLQHGVDITYYENEHYSTRLLMLIDSLRSGEFTEALDAYRNFDSSDLLPVTAKPSMDAETKE
jgi:hypothetical protein